jgi:hypothetical protein
MNGIQMSITKYIECRPQRRNKRLKFCICLGTLIFKIQSIIIHVGFDVHDIKTAADFLLFCALFFGFFFFFGGGCFATIFCSVISLCLLAYQTTYKHF